MFQLRYYRSTLDLVRKNNNFEIIGNYYDEVLAKGIRRKKASEPNYNIKLLVIKNI